MTPYMYMKQNSIGEAPVEGTEGSYRLTVDTPEDYQVVQSVYQALSRDGNDFGLKDILRFLGAHPEIASINRMVVQKKATD